LLNYQLLPLILDKSGFNSKISIFFSNYLIDKKTQYMWNNFVSPFFRADLEVGQGFALSSILSALYITLIFYIFEKRSINLISNILVLFHSFVDDGFFISQEKLYKKSNVFLFYSYNIISSPFNQFSLTAKHGKSEVFYFSRLTKNFNPSLLDLSPLEGLILWPKDMWRYLGFYFNRKLSFWQYI